MISELANVITLGLAPLLALAVVLLSLFAFLAPVFVLQTQAALLAVGPKDGKDGPTVWIGFLGSCARRSNSTPTDCTFPTISPVYDFSVLSDKAPKMVLSAPATPMPAIIAVVALGFSVLFLFFFTFISFRHRLGKLSDRPFIYRFTASIGFLGLFLGFTSFLIVRMWFGKAAEDFNDSAKLQGVDLIANTSNAFTIAWVAYACYVVPVVISLTRLNIRSVSLRPSPPPYLAFGLATAHGY